MTESTSQISLAPATPSMLFYAFAHRIAPSAGKLARARSVPCSGSDVKVNQDVLATNLMHAALWDLQRRERIRLEEVERKVLFVKTRSTKVRLAAGVDLAAEVPDSLEFDLLKSAIGLRGEGDVRSVVRGLYGGDAEDPYRRAIAMANPAEIAAGLVSLEVEERHGVGKVLGNKERLIWQCDEVARRKPEFESLVADWNRDHDADPAAFDRLTKEIDGAIASRRKEEREGLFDAD